MTVGSLGLYEILYGPAVYTGNKVTQDLRNIDKTINNWIARGRTTGAFGSSAIEWRNRKLNHGVDTQCNITLDTNQPHLYEHDN